MPSKGNKELALHTWLANTETGDGWGLFPFSHDRYRNTIYLLITTHIHYYLLIGFSSLSLSLTDT